MTEELKAESREAIAEIPVEMLRRAKYNFTKRLQECLLRNGAYLRNVILKIQIL